MTLWTSLPAAARLLASCAKRPPEHWMRQSDFGCATKRYTDQRVTHLRAIWLAKRDELWAAAETSGNYEAWKAHVFLTVDDAIEAAVRGEQISDDRKAA